MKMIIMTYGLPGAGKSTWAREEMRQNPDRYKRVNKDAIRLMLDNDLWSLPNERFVLKIRDKIVEASLRAGKDIIVDDTNFPIGGKHFLRMCEIAQIVGDVQVVEKYFDVPLNEVLKRNKNADRVPVPESVIYNMFGKHVKNNRFEPQSAYFPPLQPVEIIHGLYPAVICDIDGTLAIKGNRSPFDWNKVGVDTVNMGVANHFATIPAGITRIIVSGRDGVCRAETEKWLNDNCIFYDILLMREANDNRKDAIIKQEIYEKNIRGVYNILWVLDDRDVVIAMWRRLGLTVFQCNYGDF